MTNYAVKSNASGFGVAPVLYLLALIGIASSVLYSNYMQSMRAAIELNQSMAVTRDLEAADKTMAALSVLSTLGDKVCAPTMREDRDEECALAPVGLNMIPQDSDARLPRLADPNMKLEDFVTDWSGTPKLCDDLGAPVPDWCTMVGVFNEELGVKQIDPWGRYYIVCRWKGILRSEMEEQYRRAFQIISAGPDGILETRCGEEAKGDDYTIKRESTSVAQRSSIWQVREGTVTADIEKDPETGQTLSTSIGINAGLSGQVVQFGAGGVKTDTEGNLWVPGNLMVQGDKVLFKEADQVDAKTVTADLIIAKDITALNTLKGDNFIARLGAFSGELTAYSIESKTGITAGTGNFTGMLVAGAGTINGDLTVLDNISGKNISGESGSFSGKVTANEIEVGNIIATTGDIITLSVTDLEVRGTLSGINTDLSGEGGGGLTGAGGNSGANGAGGSAGLGSNNWANQHAWVTGPGGLIRGGNGGLIMLNWISPVEGMCF